MDNTQIPSCQPIASVATESLVAGVFCDSSSVCVCQQYLPINPGKAIDDVLIRFETQKLQFAKANKMQIYDNNSVYKIELLEFPPARYILNINGINCASSTDNCFIIDDIHNDSFERMLVHGEKNTISRSCTFGGCTNSTTNYEKRCLHLNAFDTVRIIEPHSVKLPEEKLIRLTGYVAL